MGLLDLPVSALAWVDVRLAAILPAAARIVLWGGIGAVTSMGLYWLVSPQRRIAHIAAEERRLKERLRDEDTAVADGLASAQELLRLALLRLGLVLLPVLVAALPVVCLAVLLETRYAHALPPPGHAATVKVEPDTAHGIWRVENGAPPRVDVLDDRGLVLQSLPISAPVPVVHKRLWWNALIGNPLGYLPAEGPVERIEIRLPERRYLSFGPDWIRGWEALFVATLLAGSLLLKFLFRIR